MSGKKKPGATTIEAGEAATYRTLRGISWPKQGGGWHDVEAGEVRSDLPAEHIADWMECGAIEPVETGGGAAEEAR